MAWFRPTIKEIFYVMAILEMAKIGISKYDSFCHLKLEQLWDSNTFWARAWLERVQIKKKSMGNYLSFQVLI